MGVQLPAFCWASQGVPHPRSLPCRRVRFAKFRYRWEVVVIFLLDVWAGLPGGAGSLVAAQGGEETLAASIAGEARDGEALPRG